MYHSISNYATPAFLQFTVPLKLFAGHMAYLHGQGYQPVTITQFIHALAQNEDTLPERAVVLTFDDGFADFFTAALPVLQHYNFSATLYITTGFIGGTALWLKRENETTRPMLTWEQLIEISNYGIECGGHSHLHRQLDTLPPSVAREEIVQSKRLLEHHLGKKIVTFAYPFGYHTTRIRQFVQEAGYTSACAVRHAMSSKVDDHFSLARLIVSATTSIEHLEALLTGNSPSVMTTMYMRTRTPVWQLVRYCSAFTERHL